jgi:hypothetical protein
MAVAQRPDTTVKGLKAWRKPTKSAAPLPNTRQKPDTKLVKPLNTLKSLVNNEADQAVENELVA